MKQRRRTGRTATWLAGWLGLSCGLLTARADVRLPALFSDHLVLQRDMEVPVWGWAEPGEPVTVSVAGQTRKTVTDSQGKWLVRFPKMAATREPLTLSVQGKNTLTVRDVLVGEVWLCSGQSNMEMALGETLNGPQEAAAATFPMIRLIKIPHVSSFLPQGEAPAQWVVCSPQTAGAFSAAGYFFAQELVRELNVPVGLLSANWGGTGIEPWIPAEGFGTEPELRELAEKASAWQAGTGAGERNRRELVTKVKAWVPRAEAALAEKTPLPPLPVPLAPEGDYQEPARLFNAMIQPLIPYGIRGALWYQGEHNAWAPRAYCAKMRALVGSWRKLWGEGEFPVYFVQLPGFQADWSHLREEQAKALAIPNTGMAVTIDIGNLSDVHPKNKQDVGLRLARWALAKTYGKAAAFSGPLYKGHKVEGNRIRIEFEYAGSGLMVGAKNGMDPVRPVTDGKLKWFQIAGADRVWKPAEAIIDGATITVSAPEVARPVAVRYAFVAYPEGANLYNKDGLPASPFRTDDWP